MQFKRSSSLLWLLFAVGGCASWFGADENVTVSGRDAAVPSDAAAADASGRCTTANCISPAQGSARCEQDVCVVSCETGYHVDAQQCVKDAAFALDVLPFPQIALGFKHSCALKADKTVWCWGDGASGGTGLGTSESTATPTKVNGLPDVQKLVAAGNETCAVIADGRLYCWGIFLHEQPGPIVPDSARLPRQMTEVGDVTDVAIGDGHKCVRRRDDGSVLCWGANNHGQLGRGTVSDDEVTPAPALGIRSTIRIFASGSQTCAQLADETLRCWGWNKVGQIGSGSLSPINQSEPLAPSALGAVKHLALDGLGACALKDGGEVWCWGYNAHGSVGLGYTSADPVLTPRMIPSLRATGLAGRSLSYCAHATDGLIRCWGNNLDGNLSVQDTRMPVLTPSPVVGLSDAIALVASDYHRCAYTATGPQCWGYNFVGQLGLGSKDASPNVRPPTAVLAF